MIEQLKAKIYEVKDFPKPGVGFKDITPLIQDATCYNYVVDKFIDWARKKKPQLVVGIESRGYIFASPVAHSLRIGMSVIRKKGKLPRKTICVRAPNEYAIEDFEMHVDSVQPGQRVVVIDDVIATGSSLISAVDLIKRLGGEALGIAVVIELGFLRGVERIKEFHPEVDVFTIVRYD